MVFLAGPRQVGKTTLARQALEAGCSDLYYSWDRRDDRREILAARWPADGGIVVLDELHKFRHWKRWIKGEYDRQGERTRFLVTGSARLDVYRRGGDSLQGRYHHYRLHPFTVAELERTPVANAPAPPGPIEIGRTDPRGALDRIERFGGFPEPCLALSERTLRRWHKERVERVFREDVRDLERIRDLSSMELFADLLPRRAGSPLSLNPLREDLEVSHKALVLWIDVLDRLYFTFRIRPYATKLVRGLRKRPKLFLWDSSVVPDPGARFENVVALHLLKLCHLLQDRDGWRCELYYLRDADGREVDFLVAVDRKPWFAVEAKLSAEDVDPSLLYYRDRLRIPQAFQVVRDGARDFLRDGVRCLPAARFLAALV
jgi:hypothetical protein